MISRRILWTVLCVLSLAGFAQVATAETLWNQSDYDPWGPVFPNSVSGTPPFGWTRFAVNDVLVDNVWQVTSVTIMSDSHTGQRATIPFCFIITPSSRKPNRTPCPAPLP